MAITAFIIVCFQALLLSQAVSGQFGGTCGSNCTRKLCTNCCWCAQMNYANYQSCGCCAGSTCCSNDTPSGFSCCPSGSTCQSGRCIKTAYVLPVTADMTCSACSNPSATVNLTITANSNMTELYIDGVLVPYSTLTYPADATQADVVPINATSCVIAVMATTANGAAGVLAEISAYGVESDSSWKCTMFSSDVPLPSNWFSPSFNDAAWDNGTAMGTPPTSAPPSPISASAGWITTASLTADSNVVCRKTLPTCVSNTCGVTIPGCDNPCTKAGKECCNCQMVPQAPQLVCACCPKGYSCTGMLSSSGLPVCCPRGSTYKWDTSLNKGICTNIPAVPLPVSKVCGQCSP